MEIKDTNRIRKCNSCCFFVKFANDKYLGWCHRNAPLPMRYEDTKPEERCEQNNITQWPIVSSVFWCGQHEKFNKPKKKASK